MVLKKTSTCNRTLRDRRITSSGSAQCLSSATVSRRDSTSPHRLHAPGRNSRFTLLPCFTCILWACFACGMTGCAKVQPWQRGSLSEHSMQPDRDRVETSLAEHMWFSREAASGGRGIGGGGCGCN
jgi:Domain of unknown function (DUF4266)